MGKKACFRKIYKGQERKAFRLLSSNGVAHVNTEALTALRDLHPTLQHELQLPTTTTPTLRVDDTFIKNKLFLDAADNNISNDVYGWSATLFFHVRGQKDAFLDNLSNFLTLLANHPLLLHETTATLLTAGIITPLNKTTPSEQKTAQDLGLPPKIRPINSGTLFTKALFAAALNTPEAALASNTTQPNQLALGTPRGIERLVHTCRAAYHKNFIIGKTDFQNGFNSLSPAKLYSTHTISPSHQQHPSSMHSTESKPPASSSTPKTTSPSSSAKRARVKVVPLAQKVSASQSLL